MNENFTYIKTSVEDIVSSQLAKSEEPREDRIEVVSQTVTFTPISNPELSYLSTTSKINFSNLTDFTLVSSISDGFQTVAFSNNMFKLSSNLINNWGVPPFTESGRPDTLLSDFNNTMTWELSRPSKIFGFELMPNAFGTFSYRVDFYSSAELIGSITRTISVPGPPLGPESQGARLFAAITDGPGFDRVVITSLSGNTGGFIIAQVRYQSCVTLCNPIIKDTVVKEATIPVKCCINIPGYEVVSVSNDISAKIISSCCEIHEDFECPQYGPIAGVKTADARIFAELQIPVTIQALGCTPITIPFTCTEAVLFPINHVFISADIKNCKVVDVIDIVGSDFIITPTDPGEPHCCVEGNVTITAKISACVMTSSITIAKCPL